MVRSRDFDVERSTADAWRRYQARLADHLANMEEDDLLLIEAESTVEEDDLGAAPYVQVCAWGGKALRGEVVSNNYLAESHRLDAAGEQALVALGFSRPSRARSGSSNFYVDLGFRDADRLAVMSVTALRDVFGVPDPAFLRSDQLPSERTLPSQPAPVGTEAMLAEEGVATQPKDQEHLQEMVDAALTPYFGHPPHKDDDGDIPVVKGTSVVFVRVLDDLPVVEMFAQVVDGIEDLERAAFEVGVLNRETRFVKYVLRDRMIEARLSLTAWPFVPEQLRILLSAMCEAVDDADDDLAVRLHAKRFIEPDEDAVSLVDEQAGTDDADGESDEPTIHPAMQTLLELDAESPGSVQPELAASICEYDRDLILELLRWNAEEEIAWRTSRDEADGDEEGAEVCEHEREHAEGTVSLLRQALRVTVERRLSSEKPPPRPRANRRPSRTPAPEEGGRAR